MLAEPKNTTRLDSLTPTTPVTSTAIYPVKMSIGHKSPTDLHSGMIFLQGKPVFYFSYIVAFSFIGGGNRSTQRKPLTCRKSLTNLSHRHERDSFSQH